MYNFHYSCIKKKFDAKLLFTGIDSLIHETKVEGIYEDFYKDEDLYYYIIII